jgi:predicted Ser/Thr protein kinase
MADRRDPLDAASRLKRIVGEVAAEFERTQRILSFDEWFDLAVAAPEIHLRSAAQYVKSCFDHYGRRSVRTPAGTIERFRVFDAEFEAEGERYGHRLVGQEEAQVELYAAVDAFARLGRANKLLLLHGPNGSAKSTMLDTLQRALEAFSRTDAGALYRFAWVFPSRASTSGGIGFASEQRLRDALGEETYARMTGDQLDARITDETKDHPLLLLPLEARRELIAELQTRLDVQAPPGAAPFAISEDLRDGELSLRNRRIYDALLAAHRGDLRQVLRHVQVERLFMSRQYRQGIVTVEPKQTVDAGSFPVTGDKAFASLPPSVAGQLLFGARGDLVDGNRGVVNFSDLLKRGYEHFKYLLTATETGTVSLDHLVLRLDVLFTGSANDLDLFEFRRRHGGEYQSFGARLELVRVPLLLDYRSERKVYQEQIGDMLRGVHIAPHVTRILALWGVMTRLRRPDPKRYPVKLRGVIERLTPIDKADLYSYGRVPRGLTSEEARELLAAVPLMYTESFPVIGLPITGANAMQFIGGGYEGSFGASVRDLKTVLLAAASASPSRVVTMPRLFEALRDYMREAANAGWMALDPDGAFHDLDGGDDSITEAAWQRWLDLSDREVREALGLVDEARYLELFKRYVQHASHFTKKERLFDPVTGQLRDADESFMAKLEQTIESKPVRDAMVFRQDVLSRIGAWALSHPNEEPVYDQIFPDYFARLRDDYYEQQKGTVRGSIAVMLEALAGMHDGGARTLRGGRPDGTGGTPPPSEARQSLSAAEERSAREALDELLHRPPEQGPAHTVESLKATLVELAKHRYA